MEKLRELRKIRKITMKELGAQFGVSESSMSMYETGKHEPDLKLLSKLADFFDVSTDYLLGREDYYGNVYNTKINQQNEKKPVPQKQDEPKILMLYNLLDDSRKSLLLGYAQGLVEGMGIRLKNFGN